MMKTVLVSIGIVIAIILIGAGCHIGFSDSAARTQVLNLWFNFFSTIGSIGAVIVALYLDPLRRWLLKPKLRLVVSNKAPLCEIENIELGAKKKEEFIDICCKVENFGGSMAERCRLVCQSILTKGADMKYAPTPEYTFRPQTFAWIGQGDKKNEVNISRSFYGLAKIAEIRTVNSELGKEEEGATKKTGATHYLSVCLPSRSMKNQFIQIEGEESIILPIEMYCEGQKAEERDIMITWQGNAISDYHNHVEKLAVTDVTDTISTLLRKE